MSLYDGLGLDSKEKDHRDQKSDQLAGWSSGIKLLQSQLQLKKAALTLSKRDSSRKGGAVLAPVLDLKSRRDEIDEMPPPPVVTPKGRDNVTNSGTSLLGGDWDVRLEYDPLWPNDYEKIIKERREKKERDREEDLKKERSSRRNRDRHERPKELEARRTSDDEEMERERPERTRRAPNAGAAIAPPPSLAETVIEKEPRSSSPPSFSGLIPTIGSSVAARIMAKYGFKEGQGLGKQEQGMSQALQVEKTSKRGGKIIHEKDIPKVDTPPPQPLTPEYVPSSSSLSQSPTSSSQPDITTILKNPSKVVLLRNMVGPGEVDEDLEVETKEECGKYGEVHKCLIFEIPGGNISDEDAVRIFVEFKRVESAIKAVVDLNGRYFGGRIVKAGFYDVDKFKRLELME